MKFIFISLFVIIFTGCRRQTDFDTPVQSLTNQIRDQLSPSTSPELFKRISFDTLFVSQEQEIRFIRLALDSTSLAEEFILLRIDDEGNIQDGKHVSFRFIDQTLNGYVSMQELNENNSFVELELVNGFIQQKKAPGLFKALVVPGAGGTVLPLVILVSSKLKPSGMYYYYLSGIGGGGGGGGSTGGFNSGYYSSASGGGNGGGGGAGNPNQPKGGTTSAPGKAGFSKDTDVITVDFEIVEENASVDISKMLKCFDGVPNTNATCSIEIMADIPVDSDPTKLLDWRLNSPGHTFIQIKKRSGNVGVMQNIGFYPTTNYKSVLSPAPVEGKFVDNSNHEFNASLKMTISVEDLNSILTHILRLSKFIKYDIDEYNCTDFALEVFNHVRVDPLIVPRFNLPGAQAPYGSNTPHGVYLKLKEMKNSNAPEAKSITIGTIKSYSGTGNGICN